MSYVFRLLASFVFFASFLLALSVPKTALAANSLHYHAEVSGTSIYLSDIFTNIAPAADVVIGKSPQPGQTIDVDVSKIQRLVHYYRLEWVPSESTPASIVIRRAGSHVASHQIIDQLEAAARVSLEERGLYGKHFTLKLDRVPTDFVVPPGREADLIDGFQLSSNGDRFDAMLASTSRAITGRVVYEIEVPVATRALHPGRVVTARDIQMMRVAAHKVGPNQIMDRSAIIGQSLVRRISEEDGFRGTDLAPPTVVTRHSLVTVAFNRGGLIMTVQARALDDGAIGDTIRLENTRTKRAIEAMITGENRAEIP